jgi:Phage portal protein, SPP1 Gp6-like
MGRQERREQRFLGKLCEVKMHPIDLAYLESLIADEADTQSAIQLAREYHKGIQTVYLTDRLKEFLDMHSEVAFRLNVCKTIVSAVNDELTVIGFDSSEPDAEGGKKQAFWAWEVWRANRMDAKQTDVHEAALRDSESFVVVSWDAEKKRPLFTFHQRFIDVENGGDGQGICMVYENGDVTQSPIGAIKYWTETLNLDGAIKSRQRKTVYFPDRVERYYYDYGWKPYLEADAEGNTKVWPTPWVDADGNPLGLPVVHFYNDGYQSETSDAIPMQDAINKLFIDVLAAGDVSAFRILVALGWFPTTDGKDVASDGSNLLKVKPGMIIGTTKAGATLASIDGQDMGPMMDSLIQTILITAQITSTPASRFIATKQVAGAETLKEQDRALRKKAGRRRVLFGNAWEDVMSMARKLANLYGNALLDEDIQFDALWEHTETLEDLQAERDALGVPMEFLWMKRYSPNEVAAIKATDEYQAKLALMQAGIGSANTGG